MHQTALAGLTRTQLVSTNRQGVPSRTNANTITYEARVAARVAPGVEDALRLLAVASRNADRHARAGAGTGTNFVLLEVKLFCVLFF